MTADATGEPSPASQVPASGRMEDNRLPYVVLVVGAAAIAAFLAAPFGSGLQLATWFVPFALPGVLLAARIKASPDVARPLKLLLAGQLLYLLASVVWYVGPVYFGSAVPFPSPLDVVYFGVYTIYGAFLLAVLRRRADDSGLGSRLAVADTAILTLAMTAVLWVTVIEPNLTNGTSTVSTAFAVLYPAFHLALFALAARLAITARSASGGAAALLFLWIGAALVGDVTYGFRSANGTFDHSDAGLIATWMLSYSGLAAFAVHPRVVSFLQPGNRSPADLGADTMASAPRALRFGVLLLAALVPLGLAAVTQGQDAALMVTAAATFALALYRASLLAGDLAEQRRLGAQLEDVLRIACDRQREVARLASVVESASDAVVTCSLDGAVLDWNGGAERLYGYRADEAAGRRFMTFLSEGDRPCFEAMAARAVERGHAHVERTVVRSDGLTVEVEASLSPLYDETGSVCGVVDISRDVTERNALLRKVAADARRLDEAQAIAGVGSWEWDLATDRVVWSAELHRIFGVDAERPVSRGVFLDHVHPDDRIAVERRLAEVHSEARLHSECRLEYETRIVRADGATRWIAVRGQVQLDSENGAPGRVTGTAQDITERKLLQQELAAHARRLDEAQQLATVGSFEQELSTGRDVWSSELYRILDVDESTGTASYATYLERLHPEDRPFVERQNETAVADRPNEYEARIVRSDGEVRWVRVRAVVTHADGVKTRVSGTMHDITAQKATEGELERLARTDPLTGLANRDRFTELLQTALEETAEEREVGVLLLDLDGFKDVNDALGHSAGDRVLQEVAQRLSAILRTQDTVARLGGDEFGVVLHDLTAVEDAVAVAEHILSVLKPTFDLDGLLVGVGASVGIVVGERGTDPGTLLTRADVAMYRAKTLPTRLAVFAHEHDDLAADRLGLVADLRAAIDNGELDVAYQPVLDTATGQVSFFEALARWRHPERGAIRPDQFIPLAEQADLIIPLTRLVLRRAAGACVRWRRAGHDVRVAVNLSVQTLETGDPPAMVAEELANEGLDMRHLILEITESALATEGERIKAALQSLRHLGVTLSIDDFGTGYSAMSYLKQLPVEELKIDRSFVRDIAVDSRDLAIVRSLIQLAHSLSLRVVAEGVEASPALEVLKSLGCDFAQGYGIARPMPDGETAAWLARSARGGIATSGGSRAEPQELLIVDDSSVVRAQLSALASDAGWSVREAASAEEALLEVTRAIPDVVILDHYMTGMTGMDAVPELRRRGLNGPILLFTGFLSDALPSMRVPLDVWPVSKANPAAVLELLAGYRKTAGGSDTVPHQERNVATNEQPAHARRLPGAVRT